MNKFTKLLSLSLILITVMFTSCSKKNDPGANGKNDSDSNWKFGTYTYARAASSQSSSTSDGKTITAIAVTTSGNGGDYGAYSGSALTFTFYSNLGVGKYTIANTQAMVASPGVKILAVDCTIGTAVNTGAILYSPVGDSGITADVTLDTNGKYHITLSTPVVLAKNVVTGGGIPGAADSYSLTINNAY